MGGARLTALACALAWATGHAETPPEFVGRSVDPLIESFDRDGYVVLPEFASQEECEAMMNRMSELIDGWDADQEISVFRTDEKQTSAQGSDAYFLDSADRIHFFLEPGAADDETGALKAGMDKQVAVNKVGHGLHVQDSVFKEYTESPKVAELAHSLGWSSPEVPQSMYIFKQPGIGGEVTPHQDSTFLYTTPRVTCLGLWLALEDATLDNGCLWARPGSHKEPVRKTFERNEAYFEPAESNGPNGPNGNTNGSNPSMMKFVDHEDEAARVVADYASGADAATDPAAHGFVPLPVRAGTLVAIHGSLDHLSLPNTSPKSRHTFQLHLIEGRDAGVTWSAANWLQYSSGEPFPMLAKSAEFLHTPVEGAGSRAEL